MPVRFSRPTLKQAKSLKPRRYDGSENPSMPRPPHNPFDRFLLIDYKQKWVGNQLFIEVETDVPVHLYLRWTKQEMRMHLRETTLGGYSFMTDPKYCFVEWTQVEQNEAGDTYLHTFNFDGWLFCEWRWWGFVGTISGTPSPSATCILSAHKGDYGRADKLEVAFNLRPQVGSDDAYRYQASFFLGQDTVKYGRNVPAFFWDAGFRFLDVPVGPQDTLVSATLWTRSKVTVGDTIIQIAIGLEEDPATFTTYADFMARGRLTMGPPVGFGAKVAGQWYGQDVTSLVSAIKDLTLWQPHNAMCIYYEGNVGGVRVHEDYAWEFGDHSSAPILEIQL